MLNSDQIMQLVLCDLSLVYDRPLMFGGDANGVEVVLWTYHRLLAEILECNEEYESIRDAQHSECGCQANSFSGHFRANIRKGCSEIEAVRYSAEQWQVIDKKLGLVIPNPSYPPASAVIDVVSTRASRTDT
jgi:hypothetical protein